MINLHGYTPDQMSIAGKQYMMMSYPRSGRRGRWDRRSDEDIKKANEKALKKLELRNRLMVITCEHLTISFTASLIFSCPIGFSRLETESQPRVDPNQVTAESH